MLTTPVRPCPELASSASATTSRPTSSPTTTSSPAASTPNDEWIQRRVGHRRAALRRPRRDRRRHGRSGGQQGAGRQRRRDQRRRPRHRRHLHDADAGAGAAPQLAHRLGIDAPGAYRRQLRLLGLRVRAERRLGRRPVRPGAQRPGRRLRALLRLDRLGRPHHLHHPRRRRRRGRGRPVGRRAASARSCGAATARCPTRSPSTRRPASSSRTGRRSTAGPPRRWRRSLGKPASGPASSPTDLAAFVPHQANLRIIDTIAKRLGVPTDRVARDIVESGNTSAATIPLALSRMVERGEIPSGAPVLLLGFGSGLAYAGQVVLAP